MCSVIEIGLSIFKKILLAIYIRMCLRGREKQTLFYAYLKIE